MRDVESGSSKGFAFINFASFEASDVEKPSKESLNSLRVNIYQLERLCDSWLNTGHFSNVPDRLRFYFRLFCVHLWLNWIFYVKIICPLYVSVMKD
ncbi:unnamed protein product [Meloidogyne enterolobii]|uniref:Uncharacterized protein n=1 Tax=Meloidogyne enterolobii TaxID=390850 RepID=A0ACB0YEU6_MELEN